MENNQLNQNTAEDEVKNIQEAGKAETQTAESSNTTTNNTEENAEKTFTQEEVNKIIQERLAKEKKNMPNQEELKKFKDWQESQKTAEEKSAERELQYKKALDERDTYKQTISILEAGVNKDDVDYVLFKVTRQEGDFNENLAKFLQEHPKFMGNTETPKQATGMQVNSLGKKQTDGVIDLLQERHPNIKF